MIKENFDVPRGVKPVCNNNSCGYRCNFQRCYEDFYKLCPYYQSPEELSPLEHITPKQFEKMRKLL